MQVPALNEMFHQRYRLVEILGEGGFATVYRAVDVKADRTVALKILKPQEHGYSPDIKSRFTREVRVIAQLRDAHTVTMYDFGEAENGLLFMVFEHIPGVDLFDLLESEDRLPPSVVIHILEQVLTSLREAHTLGLLHRDIKPENVRIFRYMDDPYHVKVLDFGIARPLDKTQLAITQTGELVGTPRYMSPEQLVESELTPASDIYSLGLVTYEMLMGHRSLQGHRWSDQLDRLMTGHVFSIGEYERIGPGMQAVVAKMTARDPTQRYQSADEILRALRALQESESLDGAAAPRPPEVMPPQATAQARPQSAPARPSISQAPSPSLASPMPVALEPEDASDGSGWRLAGGIVAAIVILAIIGTSVMKIREHREQTERDQAARIVAAQQAAAMRRRPPPSADRPTPPPEDPPDPATETVDAGQAPLGGTPGCGHAPPISGLGVMNAMESLTRWDAFVPEDYDRNVPTPVVFLFHQDGRTGHDIVLQSSFHKLAAEKGFIVVAPTYPGNVLLAWRSPEDIDYVHRLFGHVSDQLCVDPDRVFMVGHGAGGDVVERLACEPWVTAVATNGFRSDSPKFECPDARPVPSILISPMNSKRMLVEGGSACIVMGTRISLKANENKWRKRNHCSSKRSTFARHDNGECIEYACHGAAFVSCHIDGGYGWPGSPVVEGGLGDCGDVVADFPTTETIWKFFEDVSG